MYKLTIDELSKIKQSLIESNVEFTRLITEYSKEDAIGYFHEILSLSSKIESNKECISLLENKFFI